MTPKRALKDALQDPLVSKSSREKPPKAAIAAQSNSMKKAGKMILVAAVAAGFICGWLAGRFLRII